MQIAYYSNHFVAQRGHGIARYAKRLHGALHHGHPDIDVTPVSSWKPGDIHDLERLQTDCGLRLLPWGRRLTPLAWTFLKRPNIEHWLGNSADVVHTLALGYPVPSLKPSVVTVHDIGPLTHPEFFPRANARWMRVGLKHFLRTASSFICVSQATADELQSYTGLELTNRLHVVPEGVEPLFLEEPDPTCLAGLKDLPPRGVPFVLTAGALSPRKNVARLLAAMEALRDRIPHHLVIVGGTGWGGGGLADRIRQSPIADRIHPLGYVSDQQLHALYSMAATFVYVSLFEGFGLPILEALAAGCPVVTSTVSSLPEVAGDAAVLVAPHDVSAIADGIRQVCTDEGLVRDLRERGRKRAAEFSWEKCADGVADVYREVALRG